MVLFCFKCYVCTLQYSMYSTQHILIDYSQQSNSIVSVSQTQIINYNYLQLYIDAIKRGRYFTSLYYSKIHIG